MLCCGCLSPCLARRPGAMRRSRSLPPRGHSSPSARKRREPPAHPSLARRGGSVPCLSRSFAGIPKTSNANSLPMPVTAASGAPCSCYGRKQGWMQAEKWHPTAPGHSLLLRRRNRKSSHAGFADRFHQKGRSGPGGYRQTPPYPPERGSGRGFRPPSSMG